MFISDFFTRSTGTRWSSFNAISRHGKRIHVLNDVSRSIATANNSDLIRTEYRHQREDQEQHQPQYEFPTKSPWNNTLSVITDDETVKQHRQQFISRRNTKFRQHVNPLSTKFQSSCDLPPTWPAAAYQDCTKPLYLDIGCGKGGFLLELAASSNFTHNNYLGLEIRPSVVEYAQTRVSRRQLSGRVSFIGCNVNVDLDWILGLYEQEAVKHAEKDATPGPCLAQVSIQFPDPHFKQRHKKRKVVDENLVQVLAKHTTADAIVFLQSDIQEVLDDMRQSFCQFGSKYFVDTIDNMEEYIPENPIGVPTEREISVLTRNLPVFRCLFQRKDVPFVVS